MLIFCLAEHCDIGRVCKVRLPRNFKDDDAHSVVERSAHIAKSEECSNKLVQFAVRCKRYLVFVVTHSLGLSVFAVTTQFEEHSCFAEQVDAFAHTWDRMGVTFGSGVMFVMVYKKLESFAFLDGDDYKSWTFVLCQFNDVFREYLIYLTFSNSQIFKLKQLGAECTAALFGLRSSVRCFAISMRPRWPSYMNWSSETMLANGSQ